MASATRRALAAAAALLLTACGASHEPQRDDSPTTTGVPTRDPNQRYRLSTTILESPDHGPQLCLGTVLDSYPPQCGGPAVAGLNWDAVANKESANGTTWGDATLIGKFDGTTFTLTEPPGPPAKPKDSEPPDFAPLCKDPEGDPHADRNDFREPEDPDLVTVWVTADQKTYNVIVRPGAKDRVRAEIRKRFAGLLCIAEQDLPSQASLHALQDRIYDESKGSPLGGVYVVFSEGRRGVVIVQCALADDVSKAWTNDKWGDTVELHGYLEPVS